MKLTAEQRKAVDLFGELFEGKHKRASLGGWAGTGKTVIVSAIIEEFGGQEEIAVCTPTGKAAHVLRTKGVSSARTLHSLIYIPRGQDAQGDVTFGRSAWKGRVAIIDEASMLSAKLVADVESKAQHVFYVGDHGQLAPIGVDPGIMRNPDVRLERIHRQAAGSPVILFAHHVRQGYTPSSFADPGEQVRVQTGGTPDLAHFDIVLCGTNRTKQEINAWIRKVRKHKGRLPNVGEQVICLQNAARQQVWNGMCGTVTAITERDSNVWINIDTDDGPRRNLRVDPAQFGAEGRMPYKKNGPALFDFGYAITVHKSQGSEWARVAVLDEASSFESPRRWRYTAATRASHELRWVIKN